MDTAREAHLYESVQGKGCGQVGRAYAATNAEEYFAELSSAFITSAGDWFPTRGMRCASMIRRGMR